MLALCEVPQRGGRIALQEHRDAVGDEKDDVGDHEEVYQESSLRIWHSLACAKPEKASGQHTNAGVHREQEGPGRELACDHAQAEEEAGDVRVFERG